MAYDVTSTVVDYTTNDFNATANVTADETTSDDVTKRSHTVA